MALEESYTQRPWPDLWGAEEPDIPPLDAYVDDLGTEDEDEDPDAGQATGRVWADRRLGALRRLNREVDLAEATARARVDEVNEWRDRLVGRLQERIAAIESQLEGYMRVEYETAGVKTLSLPSGELTLRGGKNYRRVHVVGDEDLVAFGLESEWGDRLVKVKRTVRKNEVKQFVEPGPVGDPPDVPDGYVAYLAVEPESGVPLNGVWLLVPKRAVFSAKPNSTGGSS